MLIHNVSLSSILKVFQAARTAFAQDIGSGLAKAGSAPVASSSTSAASRKPPPKPSNPYANYSTAASLGYHDPDAERLKAETELRRMQGVAGDWEVISPPQATPPQPEAENAVDGEVNRKREADAPPPAEDERSWKLRKKTVGPGLGDIYDPGIIPIKLKVKKEELAEVDAAVPVTVSTSSSNLKATTAPTWTKTHWKRAGEPVDEVEARPAGEGEIAEKNVTVGREDTTEHRPKVEYGDPGGMAEPLKKEEDRPFSLDETPIVPPAAGGSGSLFRKRKAPGGLGTRGKR